MTGRLIAYQPALQASSPMASTTIAILFADLAGYTALSEAHGDLDAADVAVRFYAMARSSLRGDARIVKPIGDAVMIVASTPQALLETTLALQDQVEQTPHYPHLRAGLHVGPAVEHEGDFFGNTINLAARIAGCAQSGEIVVTRAFVEALGDTSSIEWSERGPVPLKNIAQPVELCAMVRPSSARSLHPFTDPICRMRVASTTPFQRAVEGRTIYFCSDACASTFDVSQQRGSTS